MFYVAFQRQKKYTESKSKALMARNDYLLAIDTANSAVQRFYCEDLHNIINVSRRPLSRVCASTAKL